MAKATSAADKYFGTSSKGTFITLILFEISFGILFSANSTFPVKIKNNAS